MSAAGDSRTAILHALTEQVRGVERSQTRWDGSPDPSGRVARPVLQPGCLSSASAALDAILPEQGFRRGTLVQWLADRPGCGAATLAIVAAREACRLGGALAAVELAVAQELCGTGKRSLPVPKRELAPNHWQTALASGTRAVGFYPPAAAALGVDLERLILLRPSNEADHDWAVHQALCCPAVAAVLCWPADKLDGRMFRRWQLAAEQGGGLGLLVQSSSASGWPSWADVQLRVRALPTVAEAEAPRQIIVELLRCRGGPAGKSVSLEIDEETGVIHAPNARNLVSPLADPAARRGA